MDVFAPSALEMRVDVRRDESALSISSGEERSGLMACCVEGSADMLMTW